MSALFGAGTAGWRVENRLSEPEFGCKKRQRRKARVLVNLGASLIRVAVLDRNRMERLVVGRLRRGDWKRERSAGNDRGGTTQVHPVDLPGIPTRLSCKQSGWPLDVRLGGWAEQQHNQGSTDKRAHKLSRRKSDRNSSPQFQQGRCHGNTPEGDNAHLRFDAESPSMVCCRRYIYVRSLMKNISASAHACGATV